jgi:hypothetical protein
MNTRNTMALLAVVLLTACGSDNANTVTNPNPGGFGLGGCVPINTQIGFNGANNEFSYTTIKAGTIPATTFGFGGTHGTLTVGGGAAGGPYQRSGVDGSINLNVIPLSGAPGTTGSQLVSTNGVLSISALTQSDIMYHFTGSSTGFPNGGFPNPGTGTGFPQNGQNICVSGIAIDLGHYGYTLYGGNVYLYISVNGQQGLSGYQGYALYF